MRVIRPLDRGFVRIGLITLLLASFIAACGGAASATLAPVGEDPASGEQGQGGAPVPAASPGAARSSGDVGARDDAKIIRTGSMELEVGDVAAAVRTARDLIRGLGGYIGSSQTYNQNDEPFAEITYRIPVDRWEDALDALRTLPGPSTKVVAEQTEALDVTGQVADLAARIRNLQASETALLAISEKATRISDILEVQGRLEEVRGQIEQLQAQQADLGDRTAYATLAVSFRLPTVAAIEIQAKVWDPGAIVDEASASLVGILQALAGAGIWLLIVWVPIIVIVALIGGLLAWLLRRFGVLDRVRPASPPVGGQ